MLQRLAYLNRLVDLESLFGYSYAALSSIVNTVIQIIMNNKGFLLENVGNLAWLNEENLQQYSEVSNLIFFCNVTIRFIMYKLSVQFTIKLV